MGSAFDKILVLWTLCALTTLLCGVFLGVLYHLLGQQIFAAAALHTLVVSVIVSFRFTAYKLRCLKAAGVDTSAVTHVPVNFETQSWLDELKKQGFDPKRPVLLVWEGVSMYLSPSAIDAMMKSFGACAKGSLLAFDVWRRFSKTMRGPDDDDAPEEKAADKTFFERIVTQVSFLVGERLTFGIDADEATFLAEPSPVRKWMEGKYAFKVKEDLNCNAIDAKFLSVDGRYVARNGPGPRFVVVARK